MDIITLTYIVIFGIFFISLLFPVIAVLYFLRERKRFRTLSQKERRVLSFIIKQKKTQRKDIQTNSGVSEKELPAIMRTLEKKGFITIKKGTIRFKKASLRKKVQG